MIAVVAPPEECDVVRELFELFKTPWEFYQPDREYEVILAPAATAPAEKIPLRILFGPEFAPGEEELATGEQKQGVSLHLAEGCLPIYGSCLVFDALRPVLAVANHQGSAAIVQLIEQGTTVRLGYDLYAEIRYLLVNGQPDFNARIPSLDQHIALLREFIVNSGIPLVEIPPVPAGYPFSVCLTHDVDNPLVRNHRTDNTALGFLLRATLGSVLNTIRGRMTIRHLLKNLSAACLFPFVQLGLARDFWGDFDRYLEIEGGLSSTFFVIPERGNPGWNVCARHLHYRMGTARRRRWVPIQTESWFHGLRPRTGEDRP